MSEETEISQSLLNFKDLKFYWVIRIKAEKRMPGNDPKFTDKREFSCELGGIAADPEDQKKKIEEALTFLLEKEKRALEPKEEKPKQEEI